MSWLKIWSCLVLHKNTVQLGWNDCLCLSSVLKVWDSNSSMLILVTINFLNCIYVCLWTGGAAVPVPRAVYERGRPLPLDRRLSVPAHHSEDPTVLKLAHPERGRHHRVRRRGLRPLSHRTLGVLRGTALGRVCTLKNYGCVCTFTVLIEMCFVGRLPYRGSTHWPCRQPIQGIQLPDHEFARENAQRVGIQVSQKTYHLCIL